MGTVGYEDVDCDTIDHTFIRTASTGLDTLLRREVAAFSEELKKSSGVKSGQISLEFFQRKRTRWPFPPENIPWEVKYSHHTHKVKILLYIITRNNLIRLTKPCKKSIKM